MKKFSFKTILILVLALILVFSLVACNKDEGPTEDPNSGINEDIDPTKIKSEQFFTDLWAASNSIGSKKIEADDNIGLTADMSLKVKIKDAKTVYKEIDLGIALQLILDRKNGGTDSAAKIKLYNADTKANWITLYYFLNDEDYLYIDYQGKNIKFNFDFGWNDQIPDIFNDALTSEFAGTSILDIVEDITATTGAEFNLNNLVNTILGIVKEAAGFDISTLINDNRSLLEDTLGIKGIVDDKGNVNLMAVFNSSIIKSFLKNSKCVPAADGSKAYSTDIVLSKTITGALSGLLGDFGSILNNIGINLSFGTKADGSIDGFKIAVDVKGLQGTDANSGKAMYPAVEIAINNLEFVSVDTAKAGQYLGIDTSKYEGDVAIDIALELDSQGVTLTPKTIDPGYCTAHSSEEVQLDGKYVVRIQGNMDLSKLAADDSCYLYISVEQYLEEVLKPVELIYNGKTIILKMNKGVKTADSKLIVEEIINALGRPIVDAMDNLLVPEDKDTKINPLIGTILVEEGGYLKLAAGAPDYVQLDVDLEKLLKFVVNTVGNMFGFNSAAEEEAAECQYPFTMNKLATIVNDVITALNTEDGLGVALPNKTIVQIMADWFKWNKATLPVRTETEREVLYARAIGYNQNWFTTFRNLGFFADTTTKTYVDYNSLTKEETELMWAYATGAKTYTDYTSAVTTPVEEPTFDSAINSLNVYFGDKVVKFAACPEAHWTEAVFNNLKNASVNISLDNGAKIVVNASMDATTKAKLTLSVNANTSLTRAAMADIYANIADPDDMAGNTLDLGEIIIGIDTNGVWYASGEKIAELYTDVTPG